MWTNENRALYNRSDLRYPSDLIDAEWALIQPLIPPGKPGGNKQTVNMREVVNGLMYILSTGCQWRAIPKDLAARSTVNRYFLLWRGMARSIASITNFTSNAGNLPNERPARPPRSSIARASRVPKKGGAYRHTWV